MSRIAITLVHHRSAPLSPTMVATVNRGVPVTLITEKSAHDVGLLYPNYDVRPTPGGVLIRRRP